MAKKTFDLFCPQCNILVAAKVIAAAPGDLRADTTTFDDFPDAEYRSEHYSIALCGRCASAFLVRESLYGVPGEFETITDTTLLYPSQTKLDLDGVPERVRDTYDQATKAFGAGLYEPCALMCRRCLELLCKSFKVPGQTLAYRLDALATAGTIDSRLVSWGHGIRLLGNEAAHEESSAIELEDARDVLDFTEAMLLYVFSLNRRFERFKTRREYK